MTHGEAVELVRSWNRRYNGGRHTDEPDIENDISFWRVGHNASHEFYAGVSEDGKLYQRSVGERLPDEMPDEDYIPEIEVDIRQVADFSGYYGHF